MIEKSVRVAPSENPGYQVYPNPAADIVQIRFNAETDNLYNISVVDKNGKKIAQITEGILKKGAYSFEWDTSKMTNGLYYIVIQRGGEKSTMKVIVSK